MGSRRSAPCLLFSPGLSWIAAVKGSEFKVWVPGIRACGSGLKVQGLGVRALRAAPSDFSRSFLDCSCSGIRDQVLGLMVQGSGIQVQGFDLGVRGKSWQSGLSAPRLLVSPGLSSIASV